MFFVVRLFDQNILIPLEHCDFVFECSIIVVIIFGVDNIVGFDNLFNNYRILMKLPSLRLWRPTLTI